MQDVKSAIGQLQATTSRLEQTTSRLEATTGRLEETTAKLGERMGRVEIGIAEIKAMLAATLPHLATKAEVAELRTEMVAGFADKPGKTYMWGIIAALLTAYACGLAALAILK